MNNLSRLLLFICLIFLCPSNGTAEFPSRHEFFVTASHSGKCLSYQVAQNQLRQDTCVGNDAQKIILEIRNPNSGFGALYNPINPSNPFQYHTRVMSNSINNNAAVLISAPSDSSYDISAQWILLPSSSPGYYKIQNQNSGKCLEVAGASFGNGAGVVQYTCDQARSHQNWQLEPVGNYRPIRSFYNNKCLERSFLAQAMVQYNCTNNSAQRWKFIPTGSSGVVSLVNESVAQVCMDIQNGTSANGAPVVPFQCVGILRPSQNFRFEFIRTEPSGQRVYNIKTLTQSYPSHPDKCLQVSGTSTANNVLVVQWDCLGTPQQEFVVD